MQIISKYICIKIDNNIGRSKLYFQYLIRTIVPIPIVPQAWHNILVFIQMAVHGPRDNADLGVGRGHCLKTLWAAHQIKEQDVLSLHPMVLRN